MKFRHRLDQFRTAVLNDETTAPLVHVMLAGFLSGAFSAAFEAGDDALLADITALCAQFEVEISHFAGMH